MISLTIFESMFDNKTKNQLQLDDWSEFETLLYNLSKVPYKSKKSARLISPATYKPGTTRCNDAVEKWGGWVALDIDKHDFDPKELENELRNRYGAYYYICYSTASSTIDNPKFRLVLPLDREVQRDEIKQLWYAINKEFNELGDAQTKDLSRMYYVPGNYDNANNFIFRNVGDRVSVSSLIKKHPMPVKQDKGLYSHLPKAMQKMFMKYKLEQLNKTDITWTSYKDCPFVSKEMLDHWMSIAFIDNSGRYSDFYKLMCSIASRAVKMGYPINSQQIIELSREIDRDTSNRYQKRRLDVEANNAIEIAMKGI